MAVKKLLIESEYYYRLRDISKMQPQNIRDKLIEFLSEVEPRKLRTSSQNNAIHKDCELIAEKLNDAGLDMRIVLKKDIDIPWTTESVKNHIWRPIMKAMFKKESTTELEKSNEEISKIHEVIMRELGEKWKIEYHLFPNNPNKGLSHKRLIWELL